MTKTRKGQRYYVATEISLSRETWYNEKKKDPRDMRRHSMVSEPRFINT